MSSVKVGDRRIGDGSPVYIIAEMACAHDGDINKAKQLIDAAVKANSDAIQLQLFSLNALMTPNHEVYDTLTKIEFSPLQWLDICDYARKYKIDIIACTYDLPSVELALKLGVDGIKLNSSDLSNPEVLEAVAYSKLFFTIGTGASTIEEIAQAVQKSLEIGNDNFVLMHGVQNFPTVIKNAKINKIKILHKVFNNPIGYQDHTDASSYFSRVVDLIAIGAGAAVIEKHITLDRSEKGTDYQAALEPDEFKEYVGLIRYADNALGENGLSPLSADEIKYRKFQKKSIVASRYLKKGHKLRREDVAFMRSPTIADLTPKDFRIIEGKELLTDVNKHDILFLKQIAV